MKQNLEKKVNENELTLKEIFRDVGLGLLPYYGEKVVWKMFDHDDSNMKISIKVFYVAIKYTAYGLSAKYIYDNIF